jgi:DNA-directed RNA polymerase specialized sigma subunit
LIQVAAIGMMGAIRKYDPNISKFSTYAINCIRNAIKKHLSRQKKDLYSGDVDSCVNGETNFWLEYVPEHKLTRREKEALYLKWHGYSAREIGEDMGIKVSAVRNLLHKAYGKIREANEKNLDG